MIAPRLHFRRRLALLGASTVLAAVMSACGTSESSDPHAPTSLSEAAVKIQLGSASDYEELATAKQTLFDIARQSDVVGVGEIVDVREGYREKITGGEPIELQRMLFVIQPLRLLKGADALGASGQVFIDHDAPPLDVQTGSRGIDGIRKAAVGSRVVFLLSPGPDRGSGERLDEFAGRAQDDPLFLPTHPASFLGIDAERRIAFPLLTDEKIVSDRGNLQPFAELRTSVERFSTAGSAPLRTSAP